MTQQEFNRKQLDTYLDVAYMHPHTQKEKDLQNLKLMRYSIMHSSIWYRNGMIATLDRAIALLEKQNDKENKND